MLCFFPCTAFAGSMQNWELAYQTDVQGNLLYGDLASFHEAVRNGADVKVVRMVNGGEQAITLTDVTAQPDGKVWARFIRHVRWSNGTMDDVALLSATYFSSTGWIENAYFGIPSNGIPARPANPAPGYEALKWYINR
jgi:hypothetical protein